MPLAYTWNELLWEGIILSTIAEYNPLYNLLLQQFHSTDSDYLNYDLLHIIKMQYLFCQIYTKF